MKWIGQHIYDLVARFRNDVYLEDISTSTETNMLVVDSDGKVSKRAIDAIDVDVSDFMTNGVDNRVLTATGTDAINAEANLTFDSNELLLTSSTSPRVTIKTTNTTANASSELRFQKDADNTEDNELIGLISFYGENNAGTPETIEYAQMVGLMSDQIDGQESGALYIGVAAYDNTMYYGLILNGNTNADGEVDVTIANGSGSTTTVAGDLTISGSDLTFDNVALTGIQKADEAFADNDTSLMTSAAIDDRINAAAGDVSPKVFGSTIKILPSDFMTNDDGGSTKFGIGFKEDDSASFGMKIPSANTELLAFVSIPEGMKATHVDIFDNSHNNAIEVFEANVNSRTITSKGSGNCNTTLDITDVNATATNYLMILVTTTATSDRTYGGTITIALQ